MKVIFIKNVFLPFLANTDPPSYKSNPFYFSKIILFFFNIFFDQKGLIQSSFWTHNSNNAKVKDFFWHQKLTEKRSRQSIDDYFSFWLKFSTRNVLDILNISSLSHWVAKKYQSYPKKKIGNTDPRSDRSADILIRSQIDLVNNT